MSHIRIENIDSLKSIAGPPRTTPGSTAAPAAVPSRSFGQVFSETLRKASGLDFSAHAQRRIESRGIALGPAEYDRLSDACRKLAEKGSKDAVVLMDDRAFVVSVKNRVVVTVMDQNETQKNVFTNIDSAIVA